jgi:hypothetical protein
MSTSRRNPTQPLRLDIQIIEAYGADPGWWRPWSEAGRVLVDLGLGREAAGGLRWAVLVDGTLAGSGASPSAEDAAAAAYNTLRQHLARTLRAAPLAWELRWASGDGTVCAGLAPSPGAAVDAALQAAGWGVAQEPARVERIEN